MVLISLALVSLLLACKPENNNDKGTLTWTGLETTKVVAGNDVDLKEGLSVVDSIDGDITKDVIILNDVDNESELKDQGWLDDYLDFEPNLTGSYHVYYKVTNSTNVTEYKSKQFVVEQGYNVVNGNFGLKKAFWTLDAPGGTATWNVASDGFAHILIQNSGTEWWSIQFIQTVKLTAGKTYKMTVEAKSPNEKSISFAFEDPTQNYKMLLGGINVQRLDNEFKEYVTYYTSDENYSSAKAVLYLGRMVDTDNQPGAQADEVIIKRVKIEEVEVCSQVSFTVPANSTYKLGEFTLDPNDGSGKPVLDLKAGVSAKANGEDITDQIKVVGLVTPSIMGKTDYIVNYVVENVNGSVAFHSRKITVAMDRTHDWQILNDHFDTWLAAWTVDMNQTNAPGSSANFTQTSEGMQIEVVKKGSANWHMQLEQAGIKFKSGETYTLKIRLKGSNLGANTTVAFEVATNFGSGFATYGTAIKTLTLTDEFQDYELTFTAQTNLNNARIGFQFGNLNPGSIVVLEYFTIDGPIE